MDFETIYNQIKTSFETATEQTVYDDSDLGIRMKVIAGELYNVSQQIAVCGQQMFPQTATGAYLDQHGACRGLYRKPAGAASGELTFGRSSAAAQNIVIPEGTVCISSSAGNVTYETTEEAVLEAGESSVTVPAQASVIGQSGNIAAQKINTMVSVIAGIETVTNASVFGGGCEQESDDAFRKRLLDSYIILPNGANAKYYEDFAMQYDGVASAKAVYATNGNALSLYITDMFRATSTTLVNTIQQDLQAARELNVNVTVHKATPVTKNITATVYVRDVAGSMLREVNVSNFLQNKLFDLGVGEGVNPYILGKDIETVLPGCKAIVFSEPSTMVTINAGQVVKPGTVTITFERG